jgi:3-phosphoshikimate 1-carboxyvinyltransferase
MEAFGISVQREGYTRFAVPGGQSYRPGDHTVESDGSNASYFWAAAAITGSRIKVDGTTTASRQGDIGLVAVLEQMGCSVDHEADGIAVTGGLLKGIDVDMGHMPDVVPTLAVVAAFASGTTAIRNVGHLRAKECDRLSAVASELAKMGIETRTSRNDLKVIGGSPRGAVIETYDDHRMAMSFAVAGLRVPGMQIIDPDCVAKSFPDFWDVFEQLYQQER